MGKYPPTYPPIAIEVAEDLVLTTFPDRLKLDDDGRWTAKPSLLSRFELDAVRMRFRGRVNEPTLLRFIGLVFSKTLPLLHHKFVSEGFQLGLAGDAGESALVVTELPFCSDNYIDWGPGSSRQAALKAVRAIIEWRLVIHRESFDPDKWPNGPQGFGVPLVAGETYRWIRALGRFLYPRPRDVIEFIHEAVPELYEEWTQAGFVLTPEYFIDGRDRHIALRLMEASAS